MNFTVLMLALCLHAVYSKSVKATTKSTNTVKLDLYKTENIMEKVNPMKFLQKNGYGLGIQESESLLTHPTLRVGTVKDNSQMKKMVSMFQTLHFLNVTGELDQPTLTKMASPRCGLPDISHEGNVKSSSLKVGKLVDDSSPNASSKSPQSITSSLIWPKWFLTYKINNSYPGINQTVLKSEIKKAFGYWTEASGIQFTEILEPNRPADLTIQFVRSDHDDGYPFDGAGGDLAHAFFPQDGRIHFDLDEKFTLNSTDHNFGLIAAHEFGHAIGLDHIFEPGSLMYPYYTGYVDGPPLAPTDIQAVKELYKELGPPPTTTKQTTKPASTAKTVTTKLTTTIKTTTTTKPTTTTRKQNLTTTSTAFTGPDPALIPPCVRPIDAITYSDLNKNKLHVLVDENQMWEYDMVQRSWQLANIYSLYPNIHSGSRGGYKCPKTNFTWFFKGSKMWAYKNQQLVAGFPKRSFDPMFPRSPDSIVTRQDRVYLIKGSFLIEFNTTRYKIHDYTISRVSSVFPGLPGSIQAAYFDLQARSWLYFKDNLVYKFDEKLNKVEAGYPKNKLDAWGPCMKSSSPASNQINELKLTTKNSDPKMSVTSTQWPWNNLPNPYGQYPQNPQYYPNSHHHHHHHGHHHPPYNPYNKHDFGPPHPPHHHHNNHNHHKHGIQDLVGGNLGHIFNKIAKHIPK